MNSEALVIVAPYELAVRSICVREPGLSQALVAVAHSCISPGTEARVLAGQQVNMPAFPVVPGYSAAGVVERSGPESKWKQGQHVFLTGAACAEFAVCWGAHQRHVVVDDAALTPIPHGVDLASASCAKLAAIAEHGRRLAGIGPGERVAVVGLGPIGFFAALCARAEGADVAVCDLREVRRTLARSLGFREIPAEDPHNADGFDVVIDATGASAALSGTTRLLRDKPWDNQEYPLTRLVVQGSYASPPSLPYDELFCKEPMILIPRDNQRQDVEVVLEMMADGRLPAAGILEDFGSPAKAADAYRSLAAGNTITGFFSWQ